MNTTSDKFVSMIGFAKRAGKIVYGYDSLQSAKGIRLLAVSTSASANLADGMARLAGRRGIVLIKCDGMEDIVGNNVKALGITDKNMAKAITDYVEGGAEKYRF